MGHSAKNFTEGLSIEPNERYAFAMNHDKMASPTSSVQSFNRCEEHQKNESTYTSSSSGTLTQKHANTEFPPVKEFARLERIIRNTGSDSTKPTFDNPWVILEFDEAHTMTARHTDSASDWSNFSELRRALRALKTVSVFSLFLSTTGKINQLLPSPQNDHSTRIMKRLLRLFHPFTDLGFDQVAKKITLDGRLTIYDITSDDFIAHLGRPMYVYLCAILTTHSECQFQGLVLDLITCLPKSRLKSSSLLL
jgi:hypothetical protein